MPSTESTIESALFSRVGGFVVSPALPVAWPNVSFPKPAGGYLRVTHIPNASRRLFLSSNAPHQRLGLLQVDVFVPKNQGASGATEIAGEVAQHFPADLPMRADGLTVRVTKAPDIGPALVDDTHWQVPVTIRYEAFA